MLMSCRRGSRYKICSPGETEKLSSVIAGDDMSYSFRMKADEVSQGNKGE